MKNILFIIVKLSQVGGHQRSLALLSNELVKTGEFNITIACLESGPPEYPIDDRVRIVNLLDFAKSRAARFIYLFKMIDRSGYHLIAGYGSSVRPVLGILGTFFKTPIVYCERRSPLYKNCPPGRRLSEAAEAFLLRQKSKYLIVQSRTLAEYYKKAKKHAIIPNMIDTQTLPAVNEWQARENIVLSAGRCTREKNHAMLIKAFALLHSPHPGYKLHIYGGGELEPQLNKLIDENNAADYIKLLPMCPDVCRHMNNAKIYACSSDEEGYPNALLEAMAMGMAPVSTDCSGSVSGLIETGVNGFVVPVADVMAMSSALMRLMEDSAQAEKIASKAAAVRQSNAKEKIIQQWVSFFNEVIDRIG